MCSFEIVGAFFSGCGCANKSNRTLDNKGDETTATKLKINLVAGKNMLPSLYGKSSQQ